MGGEGKPSAGRICTTGSKPDGISTSPCMMLDCRHCSDEFFLVEDMRDSLEDPSKVDIDIALPYFTNLPSPRSQRVYLEDYISSWQGYKEWKSWFSTWYLQYRKKSEADYTSTEMVMDEFRTTISLETNATYEIRAIFADAGQTKPSWSKWVTTDTANLLRFALHRLNIFTGKVSNYIDQKVRLV